VSELRPLQPLDTKRHKTDEFDSGEPTLDRWLRADAGQSQRRDVAGTFVTADLKLSVVGKYALVAGEFEQAEASQLVRAGVSQHFPIPVCLSARLAVDRRWQGRWARPRSPP
jgi:hypothetical protein